MVNDNSYFRLVKYNTLHVGLDTQPQSFSHLLYHPSFFSLTSFSHLVSHSFSQSLITRQEGQITTKNDRRFSRESSNTHNWHVTSLGPLPFLQDTLVVYHFFNVTLVVFHSHIGQDGHRFEFSITLLLWVTDMLQVIGPLTRYHFLQSLSS